MSETTAGAVPPGWVCVATPTIAEGAAWRGVYQRPEDVCWPMAPFWLVDASNERQEVRPQGRDEDWKLTPRTAWIPEHAPDVMYLANGERVDLAARSVPRPVPRTRAWVGGERRPPPYARRLRELAREHRAGLADGACWYPAVWVYAGARAWEAARRALADADGRRPVLVLPPGEDPAGVDWSVIGAWALTRGDVRRLRWLGIDERPWWLAQWARAWAPDDLAAREALAQGVAAGEQVWAPRPGAGPAVLLDDRAGPLDAPTLEALAQGVAAGGASLVLWYALDEAAWLWCEGGVMDFRVVCHGQ